ncbi:MAG TPA: hypothetical protein VML96_09790 [Egibacteraceae bacterium]|nr:hypothetical protein [Egibacteraceae bacterium]
MTDTAVHGSFRDPSGFVFMRDGVVHRQVNTGYAEHYDHLMDSGLYEALVSAGLLIAHDEVQAPAAAPGAYRILRPARVDFVSYPYEWCFSQLKDAALATLEIADAALGHGMSLRDASAYNIQFHRGRPVLIDTLSFEIRREGSPWAAYRQFCQHFLAPLALMATCDARLGQLCRIHIDGVPLDLASRLLPARTRLKPGLQIHLHTHARSQQRHADAPAGPSSGKGRFSDQAFRGLIENLRGTVRKLDWAPTTSTWIDYYATADHYSDEAREDKERVVGAFLDRVRPSTVWDLGANVGRFSRLAADRGARAVALEADIASVEAAYRALRAEGSADVLPLVMDFANPTPSQGWDGRERSSLEERGPADAALALALIHHLAIAGNVPLDRIAEWLARLCRALIIEFVPKTDPKVQRLLASREDIFPEYTAEGFATAFEGKFATVAQSPLRESGRVLYLMERR